jgi:peptide methionine sulfoxide reductase MsrA
LIEFDSNLVEVKELLDYYWSIIDPTTLNKQGIDEGPQYRSGIFYNSDKQRLLAE